MKVFSCIVLIMASVIPTSFSFSTQTHFNKAKASSSTTRLESINDRRSFLAAAGGPAVLSLLVGSTNPPVASAGIDVSGIRVEGTTTSAGGPSIKDQLRSYDGSAATRIEQIKSMQSGSASSGSVVLTDKPSPVDSSPSLPEGVAVLAQRSSLLGARVSSLGLGLTSRYEDLLQPPPSTKASVAVKFDFPSDWLQLDRAAGGIQYVDQRNGDKLYVLRAKLPADTTLETAPKQFFGDALFDPKGGVVRSGNEVEEHRVGASAVSYFPVPCVGGSSSNNSCSIARRRLTVKYATVTGNGLRVERKGLVDAYQVETEVYMILVSSTAVKFDAKGRERETIDMIADSFRIDV